jgi:hypothetical protein
MGEAGTVTIPIRGGQPLTLPANQVTYDSKTHKLNISEEMSKTAIWRLMVSDSQNNLNAAVPQEKRSVFVKRLLILILLKAVMLLGVLVYCNYYH